MVQIGFGGVNVAPSILIGPNPGESVSRRVQSQETSRPVREPEETDDGGDRPPTTLVDSRDRSEEIRAQESAAEDEIQAAQDVRRREIEDQEPRPGDRVDIRA
jgi:hypothetical protein